jgi:hypothetical protein
MEGHLRPATLCDFEQPLRLYILERWLLFSGLAKRSSCHIGLQGTTQLTSHSLGADGTMQGRAGWEPWLVGYTLWSHSAGSCIRLELQQRSLQHAYRTAVGMVAFAHWHRAAPRSSWSCKGPDQLDSSTGYTKLVLHISNVLYKISARRLPLKNVA